MWKYISKLLGNSDETPSPIPLVQITSENTAQNLSVVERCSVEEFWKKVGYLSHETYRFLHQTYSPGSRIPCADFTAFFVERLRIGDLDSIKEVMRAILAANPGVGGGPEWINGIVEEVAGIDFGRYCISPNPNFLLELQALFILGAKDGGGREFWVTEEKPQLFASTLCPYEIRWLDGMDELRQKANCFIRAMRKEVPYWKSVTLFSNPRDGDAPPHGFPAASILLGMPALARLHLMYFSTCGSSSLPNATNYSMRNLGVNPLETTPLLLASGICEIANDVSDVEKILSKTDIVNALDASAVAYRKSWAKSQLFEALYTHDPAFVLSVAERQNIARVKPEYLAEIQALSSVAETITNNLKLLCFINTDA